MARLMLSKACERYDEAMDELPRNALRIAFFGGSFDPPHIGHLAVARAARVALALDTVLFAPVGSQPLKPQGATAGFGDRVEMTRLAIAGEPAFAVSLADAPAASGEPNYTMETLLGLRAQLPEGGALYCLMGADSFLSLKRWHRAAEIPFAAPLIVAARPNESLEDLAAALPAGLTIEAEPEGIPAASSPGSGVHVRDYRLRNPAGETAPFYLLPELHEEASATGFRDQIQAGSGESFVPTAVAAYIRSHGLYR